VKLVTHPCAVGEEATWDQAGSSRGLEQHHQAQKTHAAPAAGAGLAMIPTGGEAALRQPVATLATNSTSGAVTAPT